MAYTISQDKEQMRLSVALQQQADISDVRLIELTAIRKCPLPRGEGDTLSLSFAVEFKPKTTEEANGRLNIATWFSCKIINDNSKEELVVVHCVIEAEYNLAEGFRPSAEQIDAFKQGPAIFNSWPYFREFVQNTVVRMNYPPPTIPFLWFALNKTEAEAVHEPEAGIAAPIAVDAERPTKPLRKHVGRKKGKGSEGA